MRTTSSSPAWIFALAALALGCGGVEPPRRDCATVIWGKPLTAGNELRVEGSWDGWAESQPLEERGDGWHLLPLDLAPGEYGYRIVEAGKPRLDPYNALTTFRGDEEVSLAIAADCSAPALRVDEVAARGDGVTLRGTFLATPDGGLLDPASLRAELPDGTTLAVSGTSADSGTFTFEGAGLLRGKHTITLTAEDVDGKAAGPARAVAWINPAQASWHGGLMYHLMIDRFRGDGGATLSPPKTPGSRAGGTLDGVRAEIERGTFDDLGVTAIWLSPVYTNPIELREGRDGRLYESYHGYWPAEPREVEPRIGGEEALRALIAEAHRHGIRVIFDVVPNHVYETSPRYLENRNRGWFNDGPNQCVCGTPGCGWGEKLSTCWFASYMPDVRFQSPQAMRAQVSDVVWWANEFDADGVRIDAVPMMPRAATRRMVDALRDSRAGDEALFSIGEVYTGPGPRGIDEIRFFLGPYALDAAFDFPLMWATRDVFAADRASFTAIESSIVQTDAAIHGSGAVLGRMLDNHDTSRFISEAAGGAWNDPWTNPPPQPSDPEAYARTRMALAFILTLPGLPVIYHGDELALAGAGDPDSRRVMPDPSAVTPAQEEVRALVGRLGKLRRCSAALQRGEREPIVVGPDIYAYRRDAGDGDPVLVFFSKAKTAVSIPVPSGAASPGAYVDVVTGESIEIAAGGAVALEALSFRVLLPAGSPCHNPSP
jgi:glycosidase